MKCINCVCDNSSTHAHVMHAYEIWVECKSIKIFHFLWLLLLSSYNIFFFCYVIYLVGFIGDDDDDDDANIRACHKVDFTSHSLLIMIVFIRNYHQILRHKCKQMCYWLSVSVSDRETNQTNKMIEKWKRMIFFY